MSRKKTPMQTKVKNVMQVALQGDAQPWDPLGMLPTPHSPIPAKYFRGCPKGRDVLKEGNIMSAWWILAVIRLG